VELVDRLEDKMKLIELIVTMAYNAKINYEDVFSPVKMWDAIIYNHLLQKNIVVPQKSHSQKVEAFEGAFVKDPIIGAHNWVASFDLASLYPHLIMQYNMSPETLTDIRLDVDVERLLSAEFKMPYYPQDLAVTANGWCYRKDVRGFLPELMEKMYQDRSKYKKQMLAVQQEFEKDKGNNNLRKEISRLNNMQMAGKIALNSLYGALGNSWFRYFDLRMAEGITTSGQLSIRWMADRLNAFMNKTLKTEGEDFVIAIDTDSIYLALGKLVEKTCPNKTTDQTIKYLDRICAEVFMPFIDKGYQELAEYMNAYQQKMQMKREVLADKAIWTAKKRYILNVHNSEGVQYAQPKLKVVGLEVNKSSTPAIIRKKLKDTIQVILNKTEPELQKYIADFREEFNAMPLEVISFPRGVNNLKQYTGSPIYAKATPIAVRAALLHNHYIKKLGLTKQYQPILEGSKIKFIYLNPQNPIREDVIGYIDHLPKEFGLHEFIDYDKMFDKVYVDAVKIILDAIGWDTEHRSSLEDFF
jgi:DNA polymerase elongation subunit (family B)